MNLLERLHMVHRLLRYRLRAERAELRYLLGRDFHGGSVFDVGAHRGVYSYWMHRRFRDASVVAFEPQPELVQFLADFKQAFRLERMLIAPLGLSSRSGTLRMRRPRCHWGAATFDEFCYGDDQTEVFDVSVTTIDEFLAEHPELRPVRFIKCDVEYHEAEVLAGAERTLLEDRPELLVEWSTPRRSYRERLFRLTQRLGYAIYQFEYGRLMPCTSSERHSPPSWELGGNYLLLPRENATSAAA
ncbi:MAG: FkbM family methyltransferase [Pirellulales bacterium]